MWDDTLIGLLALAAGMWLLCWRWMPRETERDDDAADPAADEPLGEVAQFPPPVDLSSYARASRRVADVSGRADGVDVRVRVDESRLGHATPFGAARRQTDPSLVGKDQQPRAARMRGIQQP